MNKTITYSIAGLIIAAVLLVIFLPRNILTQNTDEQNNIDLSDYYDDHSEIVDRTADKITESDIVNTEIQKIREQEGYTHVQVLNDWEDHALNGHSYYILFDDNQLYCITEKENIAYSVKNDYEYYLEMTDQ